jgi:hypothetical protein
MSADTNPRGRDYSMTTETVSVTLVTLPQSQTPATVDVNRIAEDACEAAYKAVHDALQQAEGFARYGDVMPGEVEGLSRLFRTIVRSVLANERVQPSKVFDYLITHSFSGEILLRTRAASLLEALSNYSESEGMARPDRLTLDDTDGASLREYLGYAWDEGTTATISFSNYTVTATRIEVGDCIDA